MRIISNGQYSVIRNFKRDLQDMLDKNESLTINPDYTRGLIDGMNYVIDKSTENNKYLSLQVATINDVNGNPRRLRLIIDVTSGNVVDIVEEGYAGISAIKDYAENEVISYYPHLISVDSYEKVTHTWTKVNVQPKEFNNLRKLKKLYKKGGN